MASWLTLLTGKTRAQLFDEMLAGFKTATPPLPVDDWSVGAAVRTIADVGFSGALSVLWAGIASVAKGGFLRLAQELAEAELADWTADPTRHWLYLLARDLYQTTPKLSAFTAGTVKVTNASATPRTIDPSHVVATAGNLRYAPTETKALPAGGSVYVTVKAELAGSGYNVGAGAINTLTVSLPGVTVVNEPAPGATSWITSYGADTESPKELADRCAYRWARLAKLQTLVSDGYKSLALESNAQVKKVAVWPNYSHGTGGFLANAVTLYLAGETGPVDAATATDVRNKLQPYVGLHDTLEVSPCGTATLTIVGTIYVQDAAQLLVVKAAVEAALVAYQKTIEIGQTVRAWKIREVVGVAGVVNFVDTLTDFIPAKNALVSLNYALIAYQVQV